MLETDSFASRGFDSEPNTVSCLDCSTDPPASVHDQRRLRFLRLEDFYQIPTHGFHPTAITNLTTGLAVERSLSRDDFDFLAFMHCTGASFPFDQRGQNLRFPFDNAVADKVRVQIGQPSTHINRALLPFTSTGALFLHRPLEPGAVQTEPFGREEVFGQIERKAIGIVQPKGDIPGKGSIATVA